MIDVALVKNTSLASLHKSLGLSVAAINSQNISHDDKAKLVNASIKELIENERKSLLSQYPDIQDRQSALLVLQYVASIVSLEYRHMVWPYEYMAFSRRVGELWERFCKACWDCPSKEGVVRIDPPDFDDIKKTIFKRIEKNSSGVEHQKLIMEDVNHLLHLVGDINMKEDEVFSVNGIPHIVDFKSGFGSNEKGNTLRLIAVGRAYKLWNPSTKLYLLVRQEDNNNYLNVIRRSGLWEVCCADEAYKKIDDLTGSELNQMRPKIFDFENDLSKTFLSDLGAHLTDLKSYLIW
jgi:hypothetical protein